MPSGPDASCSPSASTCGPRSGPPRIDDLYAAALEISAWAETVAPWRPSCRSTTAPGSPPPVAVGPGRGGGRPDPDPSHRRGRRRAAVLRTGPPRRGHRACSTSSAADGSPSSSASGTDTRSTSTSVSPARARRQGDEQLALLLALLRGERVHRGRAIDAASRRRRPATVPSSTSAAAASRPPVGPAGSASGSSPRQRRRGWPRRTTGVPAGWARTGLRADPRTRLGDGRVRRRRRRPGMGGARPSPLARRDDGRVISPRRDLGRQHQHRHHHRRAQGPTAPIGS